MIEGLSIKAGEAIQSSFSVREMRMEAVCGFPPISQIELLCFTFKGHLFWFKS